MTILERRTRVWLLRFGGLSLVLLALVAPAPTSASVGVLESSVVECTVVDGGVHATVGVSVTGASPNTGVWLRVVSPLQAAPPIPFSIGSTDASGSLTFRLEPGGSNEFPLSISAYTKAGDKIDPATQIGGTVLVSFVCPPPRPQDVIDDAVRTGVLTEREGTPLAVKLGAAARQEEGGNTQAAVNLLQAASQQVRALIQSGRLTQGEAQPLLDAIAREVVRLTSGT